MLGFSLIRVPVRVQAGFMLGLIMHEVQSRSGFTLALGLGLGLGLSNQGSN